MFSYFNFKLEKVYMNYVGQGLYYFLIINFINIG